MAHPTHDLILASDVGFLVRYVKRVGGHDRNATHHMAAFLAGF